MTGSTAAQSSSEANKGGANKTGSISGQVVNEIGAPIAKAIVEISGVGAEQAARTVATDREGRFRATGLDPRAYFVSASFPSYVDAPSDPSAAAIGYYQVGDSVRIQLVRGGVITGTVTRSNGEPVVVGTVRAYLIRDAQDQLMREGVPIAEQKTDDRGVYRFYGLDPGTYVVSAGGGTSSAYTINGYDLDVPTYAPSSPRETAAEISVRSGQEATNVDIRHRAESGYTVSGIVANTINSAEPVQFNVSLFSAFGGSSEEAHSTSQRPGDGGFSFSGVGDGDYDVMADAYLQNSGWLVSESRRIKVKGADLSGIELTLRPLASVSGRVVLEESKAPECKDKRRPLLTETVVSAWHNEKGSRGQPPFVWNLGDPVSADQQGEFMLTDLFPGQYRFNSRPLAKYWYLKSISWPALLGTAATSRPADASRNWTTLKSGDRFSGLTITLSAGAASLHGRIEAAKGQQLSPQLFVFLVPAEREKSEDILRFSVRPAAADGTFAVTNVAPGRYWIFARAAEDDTNIFSLLRLPDETGMRARLIRDGEAAKIEVELKPCQNVVDFRLPFKPPDHE